MAKLLLNLRHVPDDEADEIRALLDEHEVSFYETTPSPWGISAGGIWVKNRDDAAKAQQLLAEYQLERQRSARAEYAAAKERGGERTVWMAIREDPLRAIAVLIGIGIIVGVLSLPFVMLAR